jgi:multicomponent Na+:H+ antiporter subunit F
MTMVAIVIAVCATAVFAGALLRLIFGPTLYDRALALNSASLHAAVVVAALSVAIGRAQWIDLSFALVTAGFVLSAAILKFFRSRSFQPPLTGVGEAR